MCNARYLGNTTVSFVTNTFLFFETTSFPSECSVETTNEYILGELELENTMTLNRYGRHYHINIIATLIWATSLLE